METKDLHTDPTRLYSLLLKIRPLQEGTLMAFCGELVHGAFLSWLAQTAPNVSAWLHEGQKRRLFTCSNLHFPYPKQRLLLFEQENKHLPLTPEHVYTLRINLLLGDLFPLFSDALLNTRRGVKSTLTPFLRLGKQLFLLEEVILTIDGTEAWTGWTSLYALVEQVRQLNSRSLFTQTFEFDSLTTFHRGRGSKNFGNYSAVFPFPEFIFTYLIRRWYDLAPADLAPLVERERIEQYLQDDGIIVTNYDLQVHHVHFTTHQQRGFIGSCTYQFRGTDEQASGEEGLTLWQQFALLGQIAFYTGVGYKTSMGLGQARLKS